MRKGWLLFALTVGVLVSSGLCLKFYVELQQSKKVIAEYKDIELLNQRSEEFAKAYAKGKHKDFLTPEADSKFKKMESEKYVNLDAQDSGLETVDIQQLFTKKAAEDGEAESFATVAIRYEMDKSKTFGDDYFQTLSINSKWKKVNNVWKVNDVKVSLLGDSSDDDLRKQAEEALRNAKESRGEQ
ncbi:hypothetical protein [Paenibacillus kribbensis]|uniref:hypothetical protein n=1 Tax=Paenibacillus kribbensis TaxID=172713 RepID=UPI00083927FD|nr:hypothetical protein [Paenibacillus kribbensis]